MTTATIDVAPVTRLRRATPYLFALCWLALAAAGLAGWLRPLDAALGDLRFGAAPRPATGVVVYVDIDSASLKSVGVWPWPRRLHARMLDELMRLGAGDVVFDVDFSAASDEAGDAEFERALRDAGGYAHLAAFQQREASGKGNAFNLPLARFVRYADPVAVNVWLDTGGAAREYPYALELDGRQVPSVAAVLSGTGGPAESRFAIDYSIEAGQIVRVSASDLIAGKVDGRLIEGRSVVIGASALELRDLFVVPRYTILPGAVVQILATETLLQGRALAPVPPFAEALAVLAILGIGLVARRRLKPGLVAPLALLAVLGVEALALLVEAKSGLLLDTAAVDLSLGLLVLLALLEEIGARGEARARAEARLRYMALHDPVTGALSHNALTERITGDLESAAELSVIALDLRRFSAINDTLGHDQGDVLLKQVAQRLRDISRDGVARLGGDNFALIVPETDEALLTGLCHTIIDLVSFPYQLADGHRAIIAASAGATSTTLSGRNPAQLLSHADMALAIAKQTPGSAAVLFRPEMDERLKGRQSMDLALRTALAERQFSLVYQPQVDLGTGRTIGAEALVRWTHPTLGPVSAAQFVAAAEETGLIVELGRWILNQACRELASWPEHIRLAVNVSPVQFELSDVVADVAAALRFSAVTPSRLDIEITEGIFVRQGAAMGETLGALHRLGVGVALDDFGTGYSSLGYLGRLPVDKIKVDQSFVRRLPGDAEAEAIVGAVMALAVALDKGVVAEGIETAEQEAMLRAAGCRIGQGYLFGRPVPAPDLRQRIAEEAETRLAQIA